MREAIVMKMIDGQTYIAGDSKKRKSLLPTSAGVYVWTLQLARVLDGIVDGNEVAARFSEPFRLLREQRGEAGSIGLYKQVHVMDRPPLLTDVSARRVSELLAAGHSDFSWIAAMATLFQRPLYVGKAINFRQRLPSHFNYKSTFSDQVADLNLSMSDLTVTLFELDWSSDHPGEGGEGTPDAEEHLTVSGDSQDDDDEDEDEDGPTAGDDSEFEPAQVVPPGREYQNKLIQLAESILIRQLQPILNQRVE